MKDPEASFSALRQPEVDVIEGDSAVGREHIYTLPAPKNVELGVARCCGQG